MSSNKNPPNVSSISGLLIPQKPAGGTCSLSISSEVDSYEEDYHSHGRMSLHPDKKETNLTENILHISDDDDEDLEDHNDNGDNLSSESVDTDELEKILTSDHGTFVQFGSEICELRKYHKSPVARINGSSRPAAAPTRRRSSEGSTSQCSSLGLSVEDGSVGLSPQKSVSSTSGAGQVDRSPEKVNPAPRMYNGAGLTPPRQNIVERHSKPKLREKQDSGGADSQGPATKSPAINGRPHNGGSSDVERSPARR